MSINTLFVYQLSNRNKAVLEWNKKREHSFVKKTQINSAFANGSNRPLLNSKNSSLCTFKSEYMVREIPTIESCAPSNKVKWNNAIDGEKMFNNCLM